MNEQSFENVKYVSFPRNDDFDDLPIEYEHMLFTRQPIDNVTDSIVERLKVSSIERSFDKRIYESNPQNSDFDDLSFDGDERLITRRKIYRINDDVVFSLKNGSSVMYKQIK